MSLLHTIGLSTHGSDALIPCALQMKLENLALDHGTQGIVSHNDLDTVEDEHDNAPSTVEWELDGRVLDSKRQGYDEVDADGQLWQQSEEPEALQFLDVRKAFFLRCSFA